MLEVADELRRLNLFYRWDLFPLVDHDLLPSALEHASPSLSRPGNTFHHKSQSPDSILPASVTRRSSRRKQRGRDLVLCVTDSRPLCTRSSDAGNPSRGCVAPEVEIESPKTNFRRYLFGFDEAPADPSSGHGGSHLRFSPLASGEKDDVAEGRGARAVADASVDDDSSDHPACATARAEETSNLQHHEQDTSDGAHESRSTRSTAGQHIMTLTGGKDAVCAYLADGVQAQVHAQVAEELQVEGLERGALREPQLVVPDSDHCEQSVEGHVRVGVIKPGHECEAEMSKCASWTDGMGGCAEGAPMPSFSLAESPGAADESHESTPHSRRRNTSPCLEPSLEREERRSQSDARQANSGHGTLRSPVPMMQGRTRQDSDAAGSDKGTSLGRHASGSQNGDDRVRRATRGGHALPRRQSQASIGTECVRFSGADELVYSHGDESDRGLGQRGVGLLRPASEGVGGEESDSSSDATRPYQGSEEDEASRGEAEEGGGIGYGFPVGMRSGSDIDDGDSPGGMLREPYAAESSPEAADGRSNDDSGVLGRRDPGRSRRWRRRISFASDSSDDADDEDDGSHDADPTDPSPCDGDSGGFGAGSPSVHPQDVKTSQEGHREDQSGLLARPRAEPNQRSGGTLREPAPPSLQASTGGAEVRVGPSRAPAAARQQQQQRRRDAPPHPAQDRPPEPVTEAHGRELSLTSAVQDKQRSGDDLPSDVDRAPRRRSSRGSQPRRRRRRWRRVVSDSDENEGPRPTSSPGKDYGKGSREERDAVGTGDRGRGVPVSQDRRRVICSEDDSDDLSAEPQARRVSYHTSMIVEGGGYVPLSDGVAEGPDEDSARRCSAGVQLGAEGGAQRVPGEEDGRSPSRRRHRRVEEIPESEDNRDEAGRTRPREQPLVADEMRRGRWTGSMGSSRCSDFEGMLDVPEAGGARDGPTVIAGTSTRRHRRVLLSSSGDSDGNVAAGESRRSTVGARRESGRSERRTGRACREAARDREIASSCVAVSGVVASAMVRRGGVPQHGNGVANRGQGDGLVDTEEDRSPSDGRDARATDPREQELDSGASFDRSTSSDDEPLPRTQDTRRRGGAGREPAPDEGLPTTRKDVSEEPDLRRRPTRSRVGGVMPASRGGGRAEHGVARRVGGLQGATGRWRQQFASPIRYSPSGGGSNGSSDGGRSAVDEDMGDPLSGGEEDFVDDEDDEDEEEGEEEDGDDSFIVDDSGDEDDDVGDETYSEDGSESESESEDERREDIELDAAASGDESRSFANSDVDAATELHGKKSWAARDADDSGMPRRGPGETSRRGVLSPIPASNINPPSIGRGGTPGRAGNERGPTKRRGVSGASMRAADASGTAFFKNRDRLTAKYFADFNGGAFDGALSEVKVTWNPRLLRTAGVTKSRRQWLGQSRAYVSEIELSCKVVDTESKLRETLLHELCHAAAWVIDHNCKPPHGEHFWKWAQRARAKHCGVPVTTCHSYEINYKYRYVCVGSSVAGGVGKAGGNGGAVSEEAMRGQGCGAEIGRHSKSIDVTRQVCGRCKGRLMLFGTHGKDGSLKRSRVASGFSVFVKEFYAGVKRSLPPGTSQQLVMQELSRRWAERNKGTTAGGEAPEGVRDETRIGDARSADKENVEVVEVL